MRAARHLLAGVLFAGTGLLPVSIPAHGQQAAAHRPPPPPAQPAGEIIVYRDRNFAGPAVSIRQDQSNLRLAWTVRSARVRSGTWELCERAGFQGRCLTVTRDNRDLGQRRVQSVRGSRSAAWREFGSADVTRFGWDRRTIAARGTPRLWSIRLCADRNAVQLRDARATFTNRQYEMLHVPARLAGGACTGPLAFASRQNLASVSFSASTVSPSARVRVRLEGR
ncbi:beta/gamma crystallin-related protein [Novosphingobium sp. BL-8H]|uniref:beta/gamma crystallin-related protein n=1 Tax=Novosphingobium sp. BL-8H TaxID=3127640 RepID=UPI00375824AC